MKAFESFLAPRLEKYIEHRLSLGYTNRNIRSVLRPFDSYTKENADDWDSFQPKFFLELRTKIKGEASTVNGVLSGVRTFFQFLVHQGHYPYNPLQDIPPLPMGQYFPFIFSSEKVDELLLLIKKRVLGIQGKQFGVCLYLYSHSFNSKMWLKNFGTSTNIAYTLLSGWGNYLY